MNHNITVRITARLFAEEKCFGPGVARLLRAVEELHSLRSAAASMNMAYSGELFRELFPFCAKGE